MIQVVIVFLVVYFFYLVFYCCVVGVGSQVQLYLVQVDRFWGYDFVVFVVFQYVVLVNVGGVGEGVGVDDGFVCWDWYIVDLVDGLVGVLDFMMINVGVYVYDVFVYFDCYDYFFQCVVVGVFVDIVYCIFYLVCIGVDCGEGVIDSDVQIIMGVDGNNCFVDIWYVIIQVVDDVGIFEWYGIVDGIWDINGGGVGVDCCFYDVSQIGNWCMVGVFIGEFNVVSVVVCLFYYIDCVFNNFIQCIVQFGGDMYW